MNWIETDRLSREPCRTRHQGGFNMTVNKTLVVGAAGVAVGAGALVIEDRYIPWQTAAAWAAGDEVRAGMLANYAFSLMEYTWVFVLLIFGGLALMASAAGPVTA
jgi:hypothetical protein